MAARVEIIITTKADGTGLKGIKSDIDDVGRAADNAGKQTGGFLSGLLQTAGGVLAADVIGGIGQQFVGFIGDGLAFNNTLETVTAQLNAFTKDGAKSAEILEMIKDRAAKTPFEFEAMAKATAALLPASKASGEGLEDLIGIAEILAASNPAEGLEGASFALKEALSGDFTSIIERFNLPRQRLKELKDQGVPDIEAVQIAMKELGLDADLVSNMANTASGRWSTFKDTLTGLSAQITKPIFDVLSSGLAGVNTWITANQPMIEAFAVTLSQSVGTAINFIANTAIPAMVNAWNTVAPVITTVVDFVSANLTPILSPNFRPNYGQRTLTR